MFYKIQGRLDIISNDKNLKTLEGKDTDFYINLDTIVSIGKGNKTDDQKEGRLYLNLERTSYYAVQKDDYFGILATLDKHSLLTRKPPLIILSDPYVRDSIEKEWSRN